MPSRPLPSLEPLKKNLQKILKKYDFVIDIIIFGSFVKGRDAPKDLDLALIVKEKKTEFIPEIKSILNIPNLHLEFIKIDEIYYNTLFLSLINEGYSVKLGAFLREYLHLKPMKLYSYNLKHLQKSQKTTFGVALNKTINKIGGEKVSAGAVLVPFESTSYFEDFLSAWEMKYKTKEWAVT